MKKVLFNIGVIFAILFLAVCSGQNKIVSNAKAVMEGNRDIKSPRCGITITERIRIGGFGHGIIYCSDENGFSDLQIDKSDIEISSFLFRTIKVLDVYKPRTLDGITYTWEFKVRGILLGHYSVSVKPFAVYDTSGNSNGASVPFNGKVVLFG